MQVIFHILRYKFISFVKTTFDFRTVSIIRGLGSLLVFGGFSVVAYFLAGGVTKFVLEEAKTGLFIYHRLISMMLFVFFMAVNMGNIIVSYATLYKSTEVGYLLTRPVEYTHIFILKFLDNFLYSSTTLFLVAFMVLLGYGNYFGYPWYVFLAVLVFVLIPFMFLSACVAVLILMSIMKIASKIGFRAVMALISSLYLLTVFLFFRFFNPMRLIVEVNKYYPNVDQYFQNVDPGFLKFLPNNWVADFLFFMARGQPDHAIPFALTLIIVSVGFFALTLFVADRFYFKSWLVTFEFQAMSNSIESGRRMKIFDFRKKTWLPSQFEVLLKKEYFQFFRETSQWIHLIVMLILIGIFVLSVGSLNLRVRVTEVQTMTYLVLYTFAGFLSGSLALRFVFPLLSLEGKSFWSILGAPVNLRTLYFIKFGLGLGIVMVLGMVVSFFYHLPFSRFSGRLPLLMYFGYFSTFFASLTFVSLNLGFGTYFSNFQEKNPIRIASSQGATLTFLVSLVYLVSLIVIFYLPIVNYFASLFIFRQFDFRSIVIPGTVFAVISAALTGFSFVVGLRSLQRDF
ncbi:MAG: hypothetical protein V1799_13460 [bacterium]